MFKKWQQGDGEKQRKCSAKIWRWGANAKEPMIPALHLEQEVWKGEVQVAHLLLITENFTLWSSCMVYQEDKQVYVQSLVQFTRWVSSDSLRPHGLQPSRFPYLSPTPRACSNSCPLSWWCHPTISSSFALLSPSPPAFNLSQHQGLFQWVSSLHQVAKVLDLQLQHQSF